MLNKASNNGNNSKPDVNTGIDLLVEVEGVEVLLVVEVVVVVVVEVSIMKIMDTCASLPAESLP